MESLAIFSDSSLERVLLIPVSILIYMSSSSWVIVANQQLIKEVGFPFPVLLSAFGAFSSATVAHISVYADVVSIRKETLEYATGKNWRQNVLPVALCQAATLALGNASYLYFGLGMVQMLKAGTPIFRAPHFSDVAIGKTISNHSLFCEPHHTGNSRYSWNYTTVGCHGTLFLSWSYGYRGIAGWLDTVSVEIM